MSESLGCHTVCFFFNIKTMAVSEGGGQEGSFFVAVAVVVGESEIHPESSVSQADPEF